MKHLPGRVAPATLALVAALVGCKKHVVEVSTTAYIVGPTNDIRPAAAAEPEIGAQPLSAAVLVATRLSDQRVKFCSGTLVGPAAGQSAPRVLTNHHCLAVAGADGKATGNLLVEACSFTTTYFGYLAGQAQNAIGIGCEAGSLRSNFEGDLAVFTLSEPPPGKIQPLALWEGDEAPAGRAAAIVHYPDVEGRLEAPAGGGARLPTAAVTLTDCKVIGAFERSEWDLDRTLPFSLRHSCDLIHGSSGSGLIDTTTGTLLGVNWGGIKITYNDGVRIDNVATRASFARAFLEAREDEAVRAARQAGAGPGQGSALGVGQKPGDEAAEKRENLGERLKKRTCGTVFAAATGPVDPTGGRVVLMLLLGLAAPLLSTLRGRQGRAGP